MRYSSALDPMIEHGGDIYGASKRLKCLSSDIIDFSSNINPTVADIDLTLSREDFTAYADRSYSELIKSVSQKYDLHHDNIALFNGASSAIFSLFEQLDFSEVVLYAPLYGEYKVAAQRYHKKIRLINRLDAVWEKPSCNALVVFVNPSTPDGRLYDLEVLLKEWQQKACTVIIDESFLEFTGEKSLREKISSYPDLYIIHSFTKFYACAGLRIGAVFSQAQNIQKLFTPMWQLSSIDVILLLRLLNDKSHYEKSRENFLQYMQRLRSILLQTGLFDEVYASEANYVLVRSHRSKEIEERLLKQKIIVRNCANFDFLDERYLRFAVKDDRALDALEKALGVIDE